MYTQRKRVLVGQVVDLRASEYEKITLLHRINNALYLTAMNLKRV